MIARAFILRNAPGSPGRHARATAWALLASLLLALGTGLSHHHEATAAAPEAACHHGHAADHPATAPAPSDSHSECAACAFLAQFLTEPDALLATLGVTTCPVLESLAANGVLRLPDAEHRARPVRGPPAAA